MNISTCAIVVILIIVIGCLAIYLRPTENYSGFRRTGHINQGTCTRYYLTQYNDCIRDSGGIDTDGNCWARTYPRLLQCVYRARGYPSIECPYTK